MIAMLLAAALGWPLGHLVDLTPLMNACRALNAPLQALAAVGVSYRLMWMFLDRSRWNDPRARHISLWFVYITFSLFVAALASQYYASTAVDASPTSLARTILTLMAIWLTVWWPHPKTYVPVEVQR